MVIKNDARRLILLIIFISTLQPLFAQTVFTYGKYAVSKQEFMRAYSKNAGDEKTTAENMRKYLELYARFKMKVQSAYDLRLDTIARQKEELMNFREQIIPSYLNDEASIELLIDEVMSRNKTDVEVAHIFIALNPNASSAEQTQKLEKITSALTALKAGRSFTSVAEAYSEDSEVRKNQGVLGYVAPFVLPYELESAVYKLDIGKYSEPIKTKLGFHILQKRNERPSLGRIKAAQILFAFPPEATAEAKNEIKRRADSVYQQLLGGVDFASMAATYSNDLSSFGNGGLIQEFGVGEFAPTFELAAFGIKGDSMISAPVLTDYGYHIIKRINITPAATDSVSREQREQVRQRLLQNDRMKVARKILADKIAKIIKLEHAKFDRASLANWSNNFLSGNATTPPAEFKPGFTLFSTGTAKISFADWEKYLRTVAGSPEASNGFEALYDEFVDHQAMSYYQANLEKFNEDFRYQLAEFKEGNLLFELMQKNIWDVAAADTAGLLAFFNKNKSKYLWEASADAILFSVPDESTAESIKNQLKEDPARWRLIAEAGTGSILADSARFELGQIPVVDRTNFTPGIFTANVKNENDNSITFSHILKVYPDRQQRSFEEAKGFVINDYQNFLEEKWVNQLKKKYPLKVNEAVFKSLLTASK